MDDKLYIDDEAFVVPYVSIKRTADVLDKYAKRTEDGDLKREIIGVYYNYQISFGDFNSIEEYERLWDKLTEPEEFHKIKIPDNNGGYTFTAYISSVSDEYKKIGNDGVFFQNLTAKFTSKKPARK